METHTSAKQPLWMAGLITQSMSGRPASGLMFFLGMDTEPPRAGIIAMTRGLPVAMLAAMIHVRCQGSAKIGVIHPMIGRRVLCLRRTSAGRQSPV